MLYDTSGLIFLSTLSLRRATKVMEIGVRCPIFLSTLSLRRATGDRFPVVDVLPISIHALLAESDRAIISNSNSVLDFYPRSPCGERPGPNERSFVLCLFLSTLSLRRATDTTSAKMPRSEFLSTLSLRRATHSWHPEPGRNLDFYPRSPCGERQDLITKELALATISIHALLAESDSVPHRLIPRQ